MKNRKQKGFTLVELLVVIAIIAILATVSIVGYLSFSKKARVSNDIGLVGQLNTILVADGAVEGVNKTMFDAIEDVKENGFDVEVMTPTTQDYEIVWDQTTDKFVLLDENDKKVFSYEDKDYPTIDHTLWKIFRKAPEAENKFSVYLKEDAQVTDADFADLKVGLDTGNNAEVKHVTYTGTDNVVIRTNAEDAVVTVNNAEASVDLYGTAKTVNVIAAKSESVHLFGKVIGKVTVNAGRVVVEAKAEVSTVIVDGAEAKAEVKVTVNKPAVIATEAANKNNITGIEQTEIADANAEKMEELGKFAGGLGTEAHPYLISNGEHLKNIGTMDETKATYYKQINDIVYTGKEKIIAAKLNGVYDGDNFKLSFNTGNIDFARVAVDIFGDVYGKTTIKNLNVYSNKNTFAIMVNYCWDVDNLTFKNIKTYSEDPCIMLGKGFVSLYLANVIYDNRANPTAPMEIALEDCHNYVEFVNFGVNTGVFISGYCPTQSDEDEAKKVCDLVASPNVRFTNCTNNANVTGGNSIGLLIGHSGYFDFAVDRENRTTIDKKIIVENVKNNNTISANERVGVVGNKESNANITKELLDLAPTIGGTYELIKSLDQKYALYLDNNTFSLHTNETEGLNYKVAFRISSIVWNEIINGNHTALNTGLCLYDLPVTKTIDGKTLMNIKNAHAYDYEKAIENNIITSKDEVEFTNSVGDVKCGYIVKDGTLYIVFDKPSNVFEINCSVALTIYGFKSDGSYKGCKEIKTNEPIA